MVLVMTVRNELSDCVAFAETGTLELHTVEGIISLRLGVMS
jgi:hypothetical protein